MKFTVSISKMKEDFIYRFIDTDLEFIIKVVNTYDHHIDGLVIQDRYTPHDEGRILTFDDDNLSPVPPEDDKFSKMHWAVYEMGSTEEYPEYFL